MKIRCIPARELDTTLQARWRSICAADTAYASPYFCVEFTQAVAAVRNDVFVGVVEDAGAVRALFPFQMKAARVAGPVGGQLSDWHGLIAEPGFGIDADTLLRGCALDIWDFDHLPAERQPFAGSATGGGESPVLDLSAGFEGWLAQRKAAGAQRVAQMQRKARKFEREVGPLRFEPDSHDPRALAQVIAWKREQCRRTGVPDFFGWDWTVALVERIAAIREPGFGGRLSVLWHGDTILGAHFGMRSDRVWHWWFPTYNHAYSAHSPGGVLLLQVAEAAATDGARLLDLGKGDDVYKQSFATGALPLLEGSAMRPSWARTRRQARRATGRFLNETPGVRQAWAALKAWRAGGRSAQAATVAGTHAD